MAVLGTVIGSFLTLITYRLPREQKVAATRSRCPHCRKYLAPRDLVPLLSWLLSRGKCRYCKKKISIRYPLTEFACALGAVAGVYRYGLSLEALSVIGLWWTMVALVVTDLEHYIILDEVQVAAGLFGLLHAHALGLPWMDVMVSALVGGMIGLALKYGFILFYRKEGLGMGDVKFLVVVGIWLTSGANFVPFLFFSGILGIAFGLLWRLLGRGERFPFGPALAASLMVCVVYPPVADGFWKIYGLIQ